jgi:hypothetical protein
MQILPKVSPAAAGLRSRLERRRYQDNSPIRTIEEIGRNANDLIASATASSFSVEDTGIMTASATTI